MFRARYAVVTMTPTLCGLVLAAGEGRRFGGPKALARAADGTPWVQVAADMLRDAGCAAVVVALGAAADEAAPLVPAWATVVRVAAWDEGVAASLREGITAIAGTEVDLAVVTPVDTPDAPAAAVGRLLDAVEGEPRSALVQALYGGRPGHPVLIGRDHFAGVIASSRGDRGARPYLVAHGGLEVECGDLWSGDDIDHRPAE